MGHESEVVRPSTSHAPAHGPPASRADAARVRRDRILATRAALPPHQDELLRDLSLFRGPFPLVAASALTGRPQTELVADIEALVAARLIESTSSTATGTEYRMPRIVRELMTADAASGGPVAPLLAGYLRAIADIGPPAPSGAGPLPRAVERPGGLTAREGDVLVLVAGGLTNREIASSLGVSVKTVMHHSTAIYRKLGVRGRTSATAYAYRAGFIPREPDPQ